jgi:hypothetical protein
MRRGTLWVLLVLLPLGLASLAIVEVAGRSNDAPHAWTWALAGGASGFLVFAALLAVGNRGEGFFNRANPVLIALGIGSVPLWALLATPWRIGLFSFLAAFLVCFGTLMAYILILQR